MLHSNSLFSGIWYNNAWVQFDDHYAFNATGYDTEFPAEAVDPPPETATKSKTPWGRMGWIQNHPTAKQGGGAVTVRPVGINAGEFWTTGLGYHASNIPPTILMCPDIHYRGDNILKQRYEMDITFTANIRYEMVLNGLDLLNEQRMFRKTKKDYLYGTSNNMGVVTDTKSVPFCWRNYGQYYTECVYA